MSKNIPDLNLNIDTLGSQADRINQILEVLRSEVLTANSSGGETGSANSPLISKLFGTLSATQLEVENYFIANSSILAISTPIRVNGTSGTDGQVLTSNGSSVFWSNPASGAATVSRINTGSGLSGGPITTAGSIQVNANTGIIANNSGLFVDPDYITSVVNISGDATQLQGKTWESPGTIGSSVANTGSFTTLTATTSIRYGSNTLVSTTGISSPGRIESTTPNSGSAGALILKARSNNSLAKIQVTNNAGSQEWNNVVITEDSWKFSSDLEFNGSKAGYRTIPQVVTNSNIQIETSQWGGKHLYKTTSSNINLLLPDNSNIPCPIGTVITIVNDSSSGNITLTQTGSTVLQLGGTTQTGNRTIAPGGFATILKVQANKWIASGPGVI